LSQFPQQHQQNTRHLIVPSQPLEEPLENGAPTHYYVNNNDRYFRNIVDKTNIYS
jgi:hypothetical protein